MRSTNGSALKSSLWSIVALLLWLSVGTTAFADLHIVMDEDGETIEYFMKDGKLALPQVDGSRFIIDCVSGEFTVVSPPSERTYWRGTVAGFVDQVNALTTEAMAMFADDVPEEMLDMFGALFSGSDGGAPDAVRTTRIDTEKVAGYDTVHYRVEYEQDGAWHTAEELWLAAALLREVEAEIGHCISTIAQDVLQSLTSFVMMGIGEDTMTYVRAAPEYRALFEVGYPVRSRSTVVFFGIPFPITTEVVRVSREPVSDEYFIVPTGYEQVENILDLGDM